MKWRDWLMRTVYSAALEGAGGGGEAAPAAAPSQEVGTSDGSSNADRMGVEPEIREIFNFDPFEAEPAAPNPPPPSEGASTVEGAAGVGTPPAPVAPPAPPPQVDLTQAVQELRQTVQELPQAVRQAAPAPAEPAAPAQDAWIPRDGEAPLNYVQVMSQVPDAVFNGLISENPVERKGAVAQLMGIGMHVAHRLATKQAVEQVRKEMSQILPQFVQEQLRTYDTMQRVYQDFYGKFPALSAPHFRSIVQQEAARLSQQLGVSGWTPEFRDRLGEHVTSMLRGAVPQAVVPQAAPATQAMGATARPVMANGTRDPSQEMAEMLGLM